MKRISATIALVLALAVSAEAQQTQSLAWDYIGLTPTEIAAGTQTVTFNGAAIATAPTCAAKTTAPTGTTCSVPLPAIQPTNTASVSLTRGSTTVTTTVNGITANAATGATSPKLIINITISL